MKKAIGLPIPIVILLFISISAFAAEVRQKAFLWEIDSETSTVYIMGSIHFATDDMYPLGTAVEQAFRRADYLVVEADAGKSPPDEIRKLTMKFALFPQGTQLSKNIPVETLERLNEALSRFCLTIDAFEEMKPWFAAANLSSLYLMFEGFSPEAGIDFYFIDRARGIKPILELESVEQQLSSFNRLTESLQLKYLEAAIDDAQEPPDELEALIAAWKAGDERTFADTVRVSFEKNPPLMPIYDALYIDRNREMSGRIESYLSTSSTYFIVVGAGHIGGTGGILDLLAHEGYRIRQIEKE